MREHKKVDGPRPHRNVRFGLNQAFVRPTTTLGPKAGLTRKDAEVRRPKRRFAPDYRYPPKADLNNRRAARTFMSEYSAERRLQPAS